MAKVFSSVLMNLGLSDEQADIYESLLTNGPQGASKLAQTTSVKRTYVYTVVSELIKRGLAGRVKKGKVETFQALSPEHLVAQAQTAKLKAELAQKELENLLPTLTSQWSLLESKPVITYYEGVEGIKKVYMDTLAEKKPILALVETSKVEDTIYGWVTKEYVAERVKNQISVRAIVASGSKTDIYVGLNEKELRETKVIDSEKFPFEHEINIYGNKVAIINHRKGSQLLGIIINQPVIAKTFRSWFELTWSLVPNENPQIHDTKTGALPVRTSSIA